MKNVRLVWFAACAFSILAGVLSGCATSTPSKFYQLSAVSGRTAEKQDSSHQGSLIVVIGPIRIPDYLDRPQIVTRSGKNELHLSEFNRWAGSLDSDIVRVLVEDVSAQLPQDSFFVIRWTPLVQSHLPATYRVEMLVERFDGAPGGHVFLSVQWDIFSPEKGLLLKKESRISEEVKGEGYDALVDAMSRAIARLSNDIAHEIMTVGAQKSSLSILPSSLPLPNPDQSVERFKANQNGGRATSYAYNIPIAQRDIK
jgi:uncharacterized lipoprotein YmbA